MKERKFGRSVVLPSTIQLKHQIVKTWLFDQLCIEALERGRSPTKLSPVAEVLQRPKVIASCHHQSDHEVTNVYL